MVGHDFFQRHAVTFGFENMRIVLQQELRYDGLRGVTFGAVIASPRPSAPVLGAVRSYAMSRIRGFNLQ
jgi:hypothetical protein